jgi:hypothetical protein
MDPQVIAVLLIAATAGAYLARRTWLTWTKAGCGGCGTGCGPKKPAATGSVTLIQGLTVRKRNG